MKNASKPYVPANQTDDANENPATITEYDEAADRSDVPDQANDVGTLTGTDRDETGPGEDMTTES